MPYKHYKDTINWLASTLSKDISFDELKTMVIVEVISEAFEAHLEAVCSDVLHALQGA